MRNLLEQFFFFKSLELRPKHFTLFFFFFLFHDCLDKATRKIYIYKLYHMVGGWLLLLFEEVEALDIDFGLA